VRAARKDLDTPFVALRLAGTRALCLDPGQGDEWDAPVVLVDLDGAELPEKVSDSLAKYLQEMQSDAPSMPDASFGPVEPDEAFQKGLAHLERHLEQVSFNYDHKKGGRLPRSHLWRPYRFCVQDVILGIVVLRHDRRYNRLEVDVFLTAGIPEYAHERGKNPVSRPVGLEQTRREQGHVHGKKRQAFGSRRLLRHAPRRMDGRGT